ncbi:hypothetical protein [Nonomuraea sp. NPDC003201]
MAYDVATATSTLEVAVRIRQEALPDLPQPDDRAEGSPADFAPLPMADEEIRAIEQLADNLAGGVIIALAAENAARTGAVQGLTLDDLDLANRRITLGAVVSDWATSATERSATVASPGRTLQSTRPHQ